MWLEVHLVSPYCTALEDTSLGHRWPRLDPSPHPKPGRALQKLRLSGSSGLRLLQHNQLALLSQSRMSRGSTTSPPDCSQKISSWLWASPCAVYCKVISESVWNASACSLLLPLEPVDSICCYLICKSCIASGWKKCISCCTCICIELCPL